MSNPAHPTAHGQPNATTLTDSICLADERCKFSRIKKVEMFGARVADARGQCDHNLNSENKTGNPCQHVLFFTNFFFSALFLLLPPRINKMLLQMQSNLRLMS